MSHTITPRITNATLRAGAGEVGDLCRCKWPNSASMSTALGFAPCGPMAYDFLSWQVLSAGLNARRKRPAWPTSTITAAAVPQAPGGMARSGEDRLLTPSQVQRNGHRSRLYAKENARTAGSARWRSDHTRFSQRSADADDHVVQRRQGCHRSTWRAVSRGTMRCLWCHHRAVAAPP